ncbi:MAG TPA: Ig-like domain-containing protein, partial [Spirochaetota bacterium]|nr:Ig-like domain-containing protein [Spirochaetota bacterium]
LSIILSNCNNPFFGIGNTPDISPPVISVTSHNSNDVVNDKITLSGKIRDDIKIKKVEIFFVVVEDDKPVEKRLGEGNIEHYNNRWSYDIDTTSIEDGPCVIKIKTFDYANNEGVASIPLIVDNYGPVVIINKPESGDGFFYYQEFQTAISCIDVTKTTLLEWQIVLEAFPDIVVSKEITPETSFEKDYKFNINPILILKEKPDFTSGYGTLRIRAKNEKGKYSKRWYEKRLNFDFSNSNPSILIIYPEETSATSAKRVGKNVTIMGQVMDNTGAKEVTITLTKPDTTTEDFVYNFLSDGSAAEKVKFFSYEIKDLKSGLHFIRAKSKDVDDLESNWTLDNYYFIVDTSFPTISFIQPEAGSWLKGDVSVTATIKIDAPDKIVKVERKINNGAWEAFSTPNIASYDFLDTINSVTAFPNGGEVAYYLKATSETDKVVEGGVLFNIDNFAPNGEIISPKVSNTGLNQTILIEGIASDLIASGGDPGILKSVSLMIGSHGPFTPSGLSGWTFNFPSDQSPYNIGMNGNESVDLVVTITDSAGNSKSLTPLTLNINQIADIPTVSVTNLTVNQKIFGLFTVQGEAADDDGVQKVQIKIDNGSWMDAIGGTQWAYKLFTSDYPNGVHTLHYRSVDINGKTSEHSPGGVTKSIVFEIDPDSPIVEVTSHLNGQNVKGNITVSGKVTKTQGSVNTLQVKIDGVITQAYTNLDAIGGSVTGLGTKNVTFSLPINTTGKNGEFTLAFKAED